MSTDNTSDTITNTTMTAPVKNIVLLKTAYTESGLPPYVKKRPSVETGLSFGRSEDFPLDRANVFVRMHHNGTVLIANDQSGNSPKAPCVIAFADASGAIRSRVECPATPEFSKVEDAYQLNESQLVLLVHSIGEEGPKVITHDFENNSSKTVLTDLDESKLYRFSVPGDEVLTATDSLIELNVNSEVSLSQTPYSDKVDRSHDGTFEFFENLGGNGIGQNAALDQNEEHIYISLTDELRTKLDILKVSLGDPKSAMSKLEKKLEFPDSVRINPTPRVIGINDNGDYRLTWQAPNSDSVQCSSMSANGEMLSAMEPCNPPYTELYRIGDYTEFNFIGDKVIFPLYGPTHFYLIQLDANLGAEN